MKVEYGVRSQGSTAILAIGTRHEAAIWDYRERWRRNM